MTSVPTPLPEPAGSDNSFARIFGALFSPKPTFASIVQRPTWIVPVILGCILFIAVVFAFTQRGGWTSFMEKQVAGNSRVQQMTAEQRDNLIEKQAKFAPIFGYVEGVIIPPLAAVIVAGVLLGIFNLSGATQTTFKVALAIVAFAWTPWLIHGLLSILIVCLKDPSTIDLQNVVASNPGAFLPDDSAKWLTALLGSIDIFALWTLFLLAIGFSATNPKKLSVGKAFALAAAGWIIFVLLKVGLTAAFA
ncbi:MAG TPA: YIP1 family protein [Candidatus Acidoferrales bacterium]